MAMAATTSIDALAVGITLSLITQSIAKAVIIIGFVTFGLTCVGVYIGKRFGHFFESGIEAIGGFVLIGLGVKLCSSTSLHEELNKNAACGGFV